MAILAACPTCQSQFKAPDHVAGRRTRCPRCGTPIQLPAAAPEPERRASRSESVSSRLIPHAPRVSAPAAAPDDDRSHTGLMIAGAAGLSLLVVLALVFAAKLLLGERSSSALLEVTEQGAAVSPAEAPEKPEPPKPPAKKTRAERLAEIDAQEKDALAAVEERLKNYEPTLQRLRKEEDELFRKGKILPKVNVRYDAYLKDLAALLPPIEQQLALRARKREEFLQARRKIQFEEPEAGDPKLEDYVGLYLMPEEVANLGKLALSAGAPRTVAQRYIGSAESAGTVARPLYTATFQHADDKDLAAVAYKVAAYRGSGKETPVHVVLHRIRGAWGVLELPGRNFTVILGMPPSEYKKTD